MCGQVRCEHSQDFDKDQRVVRDEEGQLLELRANHRQKLVNGVTLGQMIKLRVEIAARRLVAQLKIGISAMMLSAYERQTLFASVRYAGSISTCMRLHICVRTSGLYWAKSGGRRARSCNTN